MYPFASLPSFFVSNSTFSSTHIVSSARQAKPYHPAARVTHNTSTRSYCPWSTCPTALSTA
jgi:hypothetical protein